MEFCNFSFCWRNFLSKEIPICVPLFSNDFPNEIVFLNLETFWSNISSKTSKILVKNCVEKHRKFWSKIASKNIENFGQKLPRKTSKKFGQKLRRKTSKILVKNCAKNIENFGQKLGLKRWAKIPNFH